MSRSEQDEFALASQHKAEAAQKAGRFDEEIVPFTVKARKGGVVVSGDEYICPGTTMEVLAKLKPPLNIECAVTAGNACCINDCAAAIVQMQLAATASETSR